MDLLSSLLLLIVKAELAKHRIMYLRNLHFRRMIPLKRGSE